MNFYRRPGCWRKSFGLIFSRFFCRPQRTYCFPPRPLFIHHSSTASCTACGGARARSGNGSRLARIDTVTIASLNLHCGYSGKGAPYDVASALCQLGAEVICLQEAWLPDALATASPHGGPADPVAKAAGVLGGVVYRVALARWPGLAVLGLPAESGPGEIAMAVLATIPVTAYDVIALGTAPADTVPRFAQLVRCMLPCGVQVDIVNTHLTHCLTSPLQLGRLRRALAVRQESPDRAPCVIAGDLNMPRWLAHRAGGYADAIRSRSWPARRPVVQLDHVLTGPGFELVSSAALPDAGSDHLPVRAQLRLRGAAHRGGR
jgi:endonuclease/exonuclease/phosphatase family metal-dependent hydrolase